MAKAKKKVADADGPIVIGPIEIDGIELCIVGMAPMIFNKMSEKARRELLLPAPPKNRAHRAANLKHDPMREYRDSVYLDRKDDAETRLVFPAPGFKAAAADAALRIPGVAKKEVEQMLTVVGYQVRIWGTPQLFMSGVRMQNISKTPDIRTRAIVPEWATRIAVRFPKFAFNRTSVANLFAAAGQVCGVGDFRQQKGKGSFGLFRLVNEGDADFKRIIANGGREAQDAALANPEPFDDESAELWTWFEQEIINRGRGEEVVSRGELTVQ